MIINKKTMCILYKKHRFYLSISNKSYDLPE